VAELHLLHGTDPSLLSHAVAELVRRLVGTEDRSLVVDDLDLDGDEVGVHHLVAAAQTPPFLTERRVVVGRGIDQLSAADLPTLYGYLSEPLATTDLVLVHAGRPVKKLTDSVVAAGGHIVGTDVGANRRDRASFVEEQVAASGLRLASGAMAAVVDQLGEDVNRLSGLLETLVSTFGPSARLDIDDIAPYLGERGGVPPWDLTDAIDRGDREAALGALARMSQAGGRHPLVVMAILHTHYGRLLRLDGSGVVDEASAGAVLGVKGFAARKALERSRAMGEDGIHDAVQLLARADLDLRGQRELPEDAVLEVLVARLCRLARTRQPARRR
jgi:DNA polymerase-3 subunit delta